MTAKYTEQHLRKNLVKQDLNGTTLFYSLVKKEGQNISFLSNERLLVYDTTPKILFYINDFKNTPFESQTPQPKNKLSAPLTTSTYKNPPNTGDIQVRYAGKNEKQESVTIEWNFTCDTESLAKQWMALFEQEKNKLMSKVTGDKSGAFIHDALFHGVINNLPQNQQGGPVRETVLKIDEQIIKPSPPQDSFQNINRSKIKDPNVSKSKIMDSDINNGQNVSRSKLLDSKIYDRSGSKSKINDPNRQEINQSALKSEKQNINQSKISIDHSILRSNIKNQDVQNSSFKNPSSGTDWNLKFIKSPYEGTLLEFQEAALKSFKAIWSKDQSAFLSDPKRVYQSQGLRVVVSNIFTREAAQLKREFRNYHFILESCKTKMIVNVPLTCLIEWQGVVALVKAGFPNQTREVKFNKAISEIADLERYTRINNVILEKATLLDLTDAYGHNGENSLIFVDNLIEYLPMHVDEKYPNTSLRPQYLLDNVGQLIPGGDVRPVNKQQYKILASVSQGLNACIKELAQYLSNQETLWVHALELKQIFHNNGVNFKCLPRVYNEVQNKQVKKYLHTVMAAKVAKDQINETIAEAREQSKQINCPEIVEDLIRLYVEGNNSNSSEFWKNLSLRFKKQYSIPVNNSEILGGFFLNSLVRLLRINCNCSKLNKNKRIFKEEGIILPGFVSALEPKVKSYYRFTTEFVQKIRYASKQEKKSEEIYEEIVDKLQLEHNPIPFEYAFNNNQEMILEYLSYYSPPSSLEANAPLKNIPIYRSLLQETPSSYSLKITKVYLNWCIKKEKSEQFKTNIQLAMKLADYWLDENHMYHCDLFEILSDFYVAAGNGEESINFMKESLSKCIRVCGAQSKQAGAKYYELGERQLKVGRKREALQNFGKAKINMQSHQNQSLRYPQLLMRLSSLHLNNGNIQNCIEGAMQAIKQFEEYDRRTDTKGIMTEGYKIKTFEVLSRAYQISGKKVQLKEMANLCAKKFNRTRSEWTYEQMVRICLAAIIFKNPIQKCEMFSGWVSHLVSEDPQHNSSECLREMMALSESVAVMEKFIAKFDNLQRFIGESTSKKGASQDAKQFILISKLLVGVVRQDYVDGLVQQKQYE